MSKARKMTFRQRLRAEADETLTSLVDTARILVSENCKAVGAEINPYDVMRVACPGQNKSLRHRLITELANEKEAELEALYNRQMDLLEKEPESDGE